MTTLVVCEKANAARRIAHILSEGKAETARYGRVAVHRFRRDGEEYVVMGLRGHVVALDYPKELNNWRRTDLKTLVTSEPVKVVTARHLVSVLQRIRPTRVVIATDYDREGELIGLEALELLSWDKDKALRWKFSALTGPEIWSAFSNPSHLDAGLAYAGMARQIIDLVWGAALTRYISTTSGKMGRDFLSIGRVQSPTLALVVNREEEINSFVPTPYWEVRAFLEKEGKRFRAAHASNPFFEEIKAIRARERAAGAKEGRVVSLEVEEKRQRPPSPYSTTLFLADATRLGLSAERAMEIAEDLYTNGWISYPRTDNTVYPRSINLRRVVESLRDGDLREEAEEILKQKTLRPTRGKRETTDHPPIYPVRGATRERLGGNRWKVYELIARRFLATLAPDAVAVVTHVSLDIGGEAFKAEGRILRERGWRRFFHYYRFEEVDLPPLSVGEGVSVSRVTKAKKTTRPPPRYNQGSLIQEMERLNLGTKSTRHEIIAKLYERGYLRKPMVPTPAAKALIGTLRENAEEITRPEMTARLEEEMDAIARGEKTLEEVVGDSRAMLLRVLEHLESKRDEVRASMRAAALEEKKVGVCPLCGGDLVVMQPGKKRFVGCTNYPGCRQTYPLPQQGRVVATGRECSVCGAPVVKILRKGRRPWEICLNMGCPSKKKEGKEKDGN